MTASKHIWITLPLLILGLSGCNAPLTKSSGASDTSETVSSKQALTNQRSLEQRLVLVSPQLDTHNKTAAPLNTESEPTSVVEQQPEENQNLWARVQNGFQLKIPQNARIEKQVKWFSQHDKHIAALQERATPYLYYIMEEIEKRNLPTELALLPAIESAFRPFAYSSGRAAGLWQFIPSTGKLYGLNQNWWYDGRRDVISATEAALDHLQELATQFDGDWELALAAYNAGAGGVGRAIKKNLKQNKPTDYWSLPLPRETRIYVPRLLALVKIFSQPEKYNVALAEIPNEPYFASVDTESQIDLTMAADLADISLEQLYQLNPGFNRWATAPKGPHRLNVPVEKAESFRTRLANLAPKERMKWTRYRIRSGDNLGAIANKFGTTVALLKETNKLKSSRIRAGKHLLIPTSPRNLSQPVLPPMAKREQAIRHTVRKGDSLWAIGKRYGVSAKQIAKWNNISPKSTLRLGQKLRIRKTVNTTLTATSGPGKSAINYKVRRGDSLFSIAQKFKVSVNDLRRWNSFPSKYLQPGQKISLYVDVAEQSL